MDEAPYYKIQIELNTPEGDTYCARMVIDPAMFVRVTVTPRYVIDMAVKRAVDNIWRQAGPAIEGLRHDE